MPLPHDYAERVYAGVLGKIIGVYLGRPFEGWHYPEIMSKLGEINYYVHDRLNKPLIVTDDDITGTFTFLRALPDYGNQRDVTPAQIGRTWLNYIIEGKTILWWGGMGNSTEHTVYLRMKQGMEAPQCGSMQMNGQVVAEQIGAQIFIDGWAMVAPGDPEFAADLAHRAGSVSHDGEAIYGAQVVAAMEAQAFIETDLQKLLDTAVRFIPRDSVIYRMIADLREWRQKEPDWRAAYQLLAADYGYDKYGGNCHMVPNHGLIILSLLYGDDNFQKSLMIVNTCGWDTDCNSGNVGCLLGIKNGLAGIDAGPDWRGPLADRLYLPAADGGRAITDALAESYHIVNIGRALAKKPPLTPKNGARFHFSLPGAVQGFVPENSSDCKGTVTVANTAGSNPATERRLALQFSHLATERVARVATATFIPPEAINMIGYQLLASPTLYPGQTVRTSFQACGANRQPVDCRLYIRSYDENDQLVRTYGPSGRINPGQSHDLAWQIGDTDGAPIAEVGLEISGNAGAQGTVFMDYLTWDGSAALVFNCRKKRGELWQRAWVNGSDCRFQNRPGEGLRIVQNYGTGLVMQGTRDWQDNRLSADITPHLVKSAGVAARVQGMRRYYALVLSADGTLRLIKMRDDVRVLAEAAFELVWGRTYHLSLQVSGHDLKAWADDKLFFEFEDADQPLSSGAIALLCEEGRAAADNIRVDPF